ncbi:2-C-methyl-D-erythritol 4-phosphate cytidylyltransferase [Jatrophihabitans sp.]|uniref:2-C-methyl-D-erythritol 4-phosphate cytidylyltransferase n=1 Tax=Jatrophihabitans sp. TaxID=1932789 RepID=UPI0030C6DFDA|nr:2-C-methyl-D-erythritol 4-phosphate cytidylyltransferase [Jatrophihabitans sp.]
MTVAAVLVAGGSGARLGAEVPKAFVPVGGQTLVEHALRRFVRHVAHTVLVVPAGWESHVEASVIVTGGATRQESVDAGLRAVPSHVDYVLVHDVARPFVPDDVITRVLAALRAGADAVIPGLPVTDTIKRVDGEGVVTGTVDRADLMAVQTPQGFRRSVLLAAHAGGAAGATDDAALVEAMGGRVVVVAGSPEAFKITTAWDLMLAEAVAARG